MRTNANPVQGVMWPRHAARLLRSAAVGLVLACSASSISYATEAKVPLTLRGTDGQMQTISGADKAINGYTIRHSIEPEYEPEPQLAIRSSKSFFDVGDVFGGIRDSLGYAMEMTVGTIMFRGSHEAIEDRDVRFELPDREGMRRSMTHSVNYDSGLRGGTVSVADSVSAALRGSYSTREKMQRANAEKARVHAAIGNFLPRITGTLDGSSAKRNSLASGTYSQDTLTASIEATVPIYTSGVNTNTYRQAKHISMAADYSYLAEEHRAALEAVAAHVNLRLNRKIERSLKRNVTAMKRVEHIARKLYQAGDASRTDVAIAQANVESARSELDIARRTREETKADYKSVTGRAVPSSLKIGKPESMLPSTLEAAVQSAMANNPDLQSARHTAIASDHNAKAVRGRYLPQVEGYGRYDKYLHDSIQSDRQDDYSIGVRLRVPLIDFGAVPTINAARHEAAESGYKALEQGRLLRRQVERQWSAHHSASRRVGIQQRQVNAIAKSVQGVRREYEAGFRSITDVLTEQVKLVRAQISLETARHEKILSAYELAFTTAGDGIQHLALSN